MIKCESNIEDMTDEEIVKEYVSLQEQANMIKMHQDLLKCEMTTRMKESKRDRFYCDYGGVQYSTHIRNQFSSKKAKEFLSEGEIEECTDPREITVTKFMSQQALEKQADYLCMKEAAKEERQ